MTGDQTLFHRMDIVEAGWQIVEPILRAWERDTPLAGADYPAGSMGPPRSGSCCSSATIGNGATDRRRRRGRSSPQLAAERVTQLIDQARRRSRHRASCR